MRQPTGKAALPVGVYYTRETRHFPIHVRGFLSQAEEVTTTLAQRQARRSWRRIVAKRPHMYGKMFRFTSIATMLLPFDTSTPTAYIEKTSCQFIRVFGFLPSLNAYSISRVTRTHHLMWRDYLRKSNSANEWAGWLTLERTWNRFQFLLTPSYLFPSSFYTVMLEIEKRHGWLPCL